MINILFCLEPFEPSASVPQIPLQKTLMYPLLLTYASKVAISIITQFPKPSLALSPNMLSLLFLEDTSRLCEAWLIPDAQDIGHKCSSQFKCYGPGLCASASLPPRDWWACTGLSTPAFPIRSLIGVAYLPPAFLQRHPATCKCGTLLARQQQCRQ